jgi:hypothetical protein
MIIILGGEGMGNGGWRMEDGGWRKVGGRNRDGYGWRGDTGIISLFIGRMVNVHHRMIYEEAFEVANVVLFRCPSLVIHNTCAEILSFRLEEVGVRIIILLRLLLA